MSKMSGAIKELLQFLQLGARTNLKEIALNEVLSLTATEEGVKTLIEVPESLLCLLTLLNDNNENIQRNSALSLVNITSNINAVKILLDIKFESNRFILKPPENIIKTCLMFILHKESHIADESCMILSNITHNSLFLDTIIDFIDDSTITIEKLINIFAQINYNNKEAKLDHLSSIFLNLSQNNRIRKQLLDDKKCLLSKLLPFLQYKPSEIRRRGVAGTLKNCCFDIEHHKSLLGENFDVLPHLLLPLADGTEFDDEDNDKLPVELQFLPEDKKREENPEIRLMLLESLNQLCALKENREFIRSKNVYVILRELHKWEKDPEVLSACENCVDILIRTEEEINVDNLKEVEIPDGVLEKLKLN